MQPFIRQKLTKLFTALLLIGAPLLSVFGFSAIAYAAGCYTNEVNVNHVQCAPPGGTKDTQGNPVDVTTNCYVVSADNPPTYERFDCSALQQAKYYCGSTGNAVSTAIDFGCKHQGNPIADLLFGVIRFLSYGVGIVVIASIVVAGIQYTTSRGDPQATARAIERIRTSVVALLIFIFGFALLNYVIPQGFFHL